MFGSANMILLYGNNKNKSTAAGLRLLQFQRESAAVEQRFLQVQNRYSLGRSARAGVKVDMGSIRVCHSQTGYDRLDRLDPYRPSEDWLGFRRGLQKPEGFCGR